MEHTVIVIWIVSNDPYNYHSVFHHSFPVESISKRILKIGLQLPKLWSSVKCIVIFWDTMYYACINNFLIRG